MIQNLTRLIVSIAIAVSISAPPVLSAAKAQHATPDSAEFVRGGMFDASDPEKLRTFMEKLGYQAELDRDDYGDPIIYGRISMTDYAIQFYECENGEFCNSVQFVAETSPPADLSFEKINTANQRWRYARVSVAGTTLRVQMDVNLDGGVAAVNFEDTLYLWRRLIERFEAEFPPTNRTAAQRILDGVE